MTSLEPTSSERTAGEEPRPDQPRALAGLGRRLIVPAVLAIVAFIALALVADARELARHLSEFPGRLLPLLLGLSLVNYGLRFVRWHHYLGAIGSPLGVVSSLLIMLVGFLLSVTPGKAGELGKAWLVRELGGGPARRAVSAVLAERITDLLAMVILVSIGGMAFPAARRWSMVCLVIALVAVALLASDRLLRQLLQLLERAPFVGRLVSRFLEVFDSLRVLMRPRTLLPAVAIGVVAWGAESYAFAIVLREYLPDVSTLLGVFDYSASTLIGAFSMIPGGLLASEGSLTAMVEAQGVPLAAAATATIVIRAVTLWFAVLLGALALGPLVAKLRAARRREMSGREGDDRDLPSSAGMSDAESAG